MMKKTLLWETLQAVEQVEVAFEETLRALDDISHRYTIDSILKKSSDKRQLAYEAEIQAAITKPTYSKISSFIKKSKKPKKKRSKKRPIVCLQTNCTYQFDDTETSSGIHSFEAHIHQGQSKLFAFDSRATSNAWEGQGRGYRSKRS